MVWLLDLLRLGCDLWREKSRVFFAINDTIEKNSSLLVTLLSLNTFQTFFVVVLSSLRASFFSGGYPAFVSTLGQKCL